MIDNSACVSEESAKVFDVQAALDNILAAIQPLETTETTPLKDALGRTLANDIVSSINVPTATNSALDGYAVHGDDILSTDSATLPVIGTAYAGKPYHGKLRQSTAVRVMTGAKMPDGSDTVIGQERVTTTANSIMIDGTIGGGANVRQAGEDISKGAVVLKKGTLIKAAELGLLASLGIGEVTTLKQPVVAFFSTGDELCSIGEKLTDGKIYDSNRYTLFGMLSALHVEIVDLGVVRDQLDILQQTLVEAAKRADLIITSGGVSVGEADFIKVALQAVGCVNFWKVAMKPGRPLAFGRIQDAHFFGLPGNPVSVMVTFHQFVKPAIQRLAGQTVRKNFTPQIPCLSNLKKKPGRVEYQRGVLEHDSKEGWRVRKTGAQGSGILRSMSEANCLIVLPAECTDIAPGDKVAVQLLDD